MKENKYTYYRDVYNFLWRHSNRWERWVARRNEWVCYLRSGQPMFQVTEEEAFLEML